MSEFFKKNIRKTRYITGIVSVTLIVISLAAFAIRGLNWGLDFTGGMLTEVSVDASLTNVDLLKAIKPVYGESASVTHAGQEGRWLIRYAIPKKGDKEPSMAQTLSKVSKSVKVVSTSMVGSQVGKSMVNQGGLALITSLLCILGYLCFRFEWRLATGSLLALLHDVILVLGFFAATQMQFDLTTFAAVLAILGYSLNDSIIVSDRIRELLVARQRDPIEKINDDAVVATFSRTMVTSGTTLLTVAALWLMGGQALQGFSTAMFIGILSGTWSSISIGTVLPEWFKLEPKHYLPVEVDAAP
ncbi:protein translocase subunit SecF [Vibrio sp. S4M6]|uniref:protein translocase subunit SecF n=1 Tax=Vibrio sinus TaxID=2946865 RepID=UPI00202A8059|nr:protein translocase subunit SecF [Vibrio sinus]MCL9780839.1 protein translocase subunit SecF [Vibrio sinus]